MFSVAEKKYLAAEIGKLIAGLNHPEMGDGPPRFRIMVWGAESWSWADILDNATFQDTLAKGEAASPNPWNGVARERLAP
jgi:hypothetical protein